jgi:transposase-like protein
MMMVAFSIFRAVSQIRKWLPDVGLASVRLHAGSHYSLERSARTTNAIERLHEEFKRRIKTQTVLPSADTAAMLFWALLASGQINMRKVDGWQTFWPLSHF